MPSEPYSAKTRLATYGSLSPGEINHDQLSGLNGKWQKGMVSGNLMKAGWGASMGFPGLILDPAGPPVNVHIFESAELPDHWARLDEFEGAEYRRVVTQVQTAEGVVQASIYVIAE